MGLNLVIRFSLLTTKKDHIVGNCALLHISKAQLPNRKWRGVLTQNTHVHVHVLPQPPTAPYLWLAQVSLLTEFLSCNREYVAGSASFCKCEPSQQKSESSVGWVRNRIGTPSRAPEPLA